MDDRSQQMYKTQFAYHWAVPSKSDSKRTHTVGLTHDGHLRCTCRNWKFRHRLPTYKPCAHIRGVVAEMTGQPVTPVPSLFSRVCARVRGGAR